ncbi:13568_t:CDS:10 [Racocetra fulgida]|uniref:13568_t:CDS:1 n=1 Tax=Racocetra fulgida TaxID=60492 RepID=A0A9N9ACY1_9GLOM|nr:13568_t:CDS:10 [Racocetra fulgida]
MEDDNFRVELLECAKLLNLPNDDYTQELIAQVPLDYLYVPQNEKESILLLVSENKISRKNQLLEKLCLNDLDATIVLTEVLNDLKIQDLNLCCDIYEATRESYFMEEPLLSSRIQKNNEFDLYSIPTLKQLSTQLPTTDVSSEPFAESKMQQFTLDDFLSHHEEVIDDIASIISFLKENDVRNDNDFSVSINEFKFEDHYIEEPLISIKANKSTQDLPNKIIEIVPLIIDEIDINVQNDQLVPEETGVKAPLEMLNEWEGIDESTFDIEGIPDYNYVEFDVSFDPFLASRESIQLDATFMHQKLEDQTALQSDLEKMLKVENPDENWKSVIMWQSMDELEGLKFKVPQLPHPVSQITRGSVNDDGVSFPLIPTQISDLIAHPNSTHSDFQILTSFSGMKALEFELHWNPIKNTSHIEFEQIVDVNLPSQEISDILEELCSCANDDDILDTINVKFEIHDPYLTTGKKMHEEMLAKKDLLHSHLKSHHQKGVPVGLSSYDKSNKDNDVHTNDVDLSDFSPTDGEVPVEDSLLYFNEQQNFNTLRNTSSICNEVSSKTLFDFKDIQNSSTKPNIVKSRYFADTFSATKSIDDFLILRGKPAPNKHRNIDLKKRFHSANKSGEVPSVNNTPNDHTYGYTRYTHRIPSSGSQFTDNGRNIRGVQNAHVSKYPRTIYYRIHNDRLCSIITYLHVLIVAKTIIDNMPMPIVTHKYIVSARLLANRGLLLNLKGIYCKVEVFERDFEYLRPLLPNDELETSYIDCDLIIDERTGIIYYPLNLISQEQSVPTIARTIIRLAQKYSSLYVILETYTWNNRATHDNDAECILPYSYTLPVLKAVAGLQAVLTRYSCDAHIVFSSCEEMSARLARLIGDLCASKCEEERGQDRQQWESRDWMTMEETLSGNSEQLLTNDEPEVHIDDNQMGAEWINEFKDFELEELYD